MNSPERLLSAFRRETPDRVPVATWLSLRLLDQITGQSPKKFLDRFAGLSAILQCNRQVEMGFRQIRIEMNGFSQLRECFLSLAGLHQTQTQQIQRLRIVGLEPDSLAEFGDGTRPVEPAPRIGDQSQSQTVVRLRHVGLQLNCAAKRGFGGSKIGGLARQQTQLVPARGTGRIERHRRFQVGPCGGDVSFPGLFGPGVQASIEFVLVPDLRGDLGGAQRKSKSQNQSDQLQPRRSRHAHLAGPFLLTGLIAPVARLVA